MRCPNPSCINVYRLAELLAKGLVAPNDVLPDPRNPHGDRYFIFRAPNAPGITTTDFGREEPDGIVRLKPAHDDGVWIATLCPVCLGSRIVNEPGHPVWPRSYPW